MVRVPVPTNIGIIAVSWALNGRFYWWGTVWAQWFKRYIRERKAPHNNALSEAAKRWSLRSRTRRVFDGRWRKGIGS
jgi:hypothetical protein